MMKFIFVFLLSLFSFNAYADADLCETASSLDQDSCMAVLTDNYLDPEARVICIEASKLEVLDCIENSINKHFHKSAADICEKESALNKAECALVTANKRYTRSEVNECRSDGWPKDCAETKGIRYLGESVSTLKSAVCQDMSGRNSLNCVNLGEDKLFSPEAVGICNRPFDEQKKLSCLAVIKQKLYSSTEITVCDQMSSYGKAQQCLAETGEFKEEIDDRCILNNPQRVKAMIRDAIQKIERRKSHRALSTLIRLEVELENCNSTDRQAM